MKCLYAHLILGSLNELMRRKQYIENIFNPFMLFLKEDFGVNK